MKRNSKIPKGQTENENFTSDFNVGGDPYEQCNISYTSFEDKWGH